MGPEDNGAAAPQEPFTPLTEAAVSMHEMLLAYMRAGFTRMEAFDLVKSALLQQMQIGQ